MKKLLSFILIAILCLSVFTGCAAVDTVKGWLGFGDEEPDISYDIDAAAEYVHTDHMAKVPTITTGDYTVPGQVYIAGVKYTVDWAVDTELVKLSKTTDEKTGAENWLVDVNDKAEAELSYKLTATVKAGDGTTKDVSFNHTVPAYKVLSYEEFLATEDGAPVVIEGVITGIVETSKENDLYLQDEDGGYFIYAISELPSKLGLKVGMTVSVSGLRGTYYKLPQVTDPKVTIIDSSIKTVEPIDITEAFSAAEANVDTDFSQYFSMLVTLKGVKVLGQNSSDTSYYDFSLAGKQSYVRISSSTCMLSADAQTAFQNSVASHINYTADVVGLVANFGGKIYLVPVDENAFSNFVEVTVSNEEKVDYELGKIDLSDVTEDGAVTVPVKGSFYSDVTISWESDNACAVVDNTAGTITFTRNNTETTVKITATVTAGDVTKTKEITLTVDGKVFDGTANLTADKLGLGAYADGEKRVEGIIFGYTELGSFGDGIQMRIKNDKASTLFNLTELPFGIKRIELVFSETKSTYDNAPAFKFYFGNDETVAAKTIELNTVAGTKTYTITPDVATYKYFKMELVDAHSYYWAEINIVLDKPVEEHTCEFSTATCTQKATCSICGETQGDFAPHVYNEETHQCVCEKYDPEWLDTEEEMTIEEALQAPKGKKVKITGTVSEITGEWSTTHNNMNVKIADAAGNAIELYRIGLQLVVGDVVVVQGEIDIYQGKYQIKQGATAEKVCQHKTWNAATCEAPETCADCGETKGTALGHDFGENKDAPDCLRDGCNVKNPDIHTCEFVFAETIAPTCTTVGYDLYKCSDATCSLTDKRNEVPATGHKDIDGDYKCDNGTCDELALPADGTTLTAAEASKIGVLTTTTQKYYITGYITGFYNNGTSYGNVYIKDAEGNSILIYGIYKDGVKYGDITGDKPVVGDTVKLYGIVTNHNGTAQFKNAELIEFTHHTCDYSVAATCTSAAKCSLCGAVDPNGQPIAHTYSIAATCTAPAKCECGAEDPATPALGHTDVNPADGTCDRCGKDLSADAPAEPETVTLSYPKCDSTTNMGDGNNAASVGLDASIFTVTSTKNGCQQHIGLNKSGYLAVYSVRSSGAGNTLTVSVADGYKITTVKVTYKSNGNYATFTVNGEAVVGEDGSYTVNGTSFSIQNTFKDASASKNQQVHITSIEISYVEA